MPNAHSLYAALPVALSVLALAPFGSAGSLSVPSEFTTIQAAIDAASAGDVIAVAPGVYAETLTIPAELTGLRLKGKKGKVVVDAHGISANAVITIAAADVTISDIIVSNEAGVGEEEGQGIHVTGDGVLLRRVTALNCEGIGFDLDGLLGRVRDSAVIGGGNSVPGIAMQGAARVERTRVSGRAGGVSMMSALSVLRKCDIRSTATAVTCKGTAILIEGCSIRSASGDGIAIIGTSSCDVRNNRIDAGGTGILVDIDGTPGDDVGLLIVEIADNVIGSFSHAGISSVGEGFSVLRIVGNQVSGGIDGSGAGLLIASKSFSGVADDNVVTDCACDGVVIEEGANWSLSHNVVSECAEDGFDIDATADDIVLLGNSALRCGGEGIEVGGTDISLLHNVARANHLDLAAEASATFVDVADNDFLTGSLETPPEIGD